MIPDVALERRCLPLFQGATVPPRPPSPAISTSSEVVPAMMLSWIPSSVSIFPPDSGGACLLCWSLALGMVLQPFEWNSLHQGHPQINRHPCFVDQPEHRRCCSLEPRKNLRIVTGVQPQATPRDPKEFTGALKEMPTGTLGLSGDSQLTPQTSKSTPGIRQGSFREFPGTQSTSCEGPCGWPRSAPNPSGNE